MTYTHPSQKCKIAHPMECHDVQLRISASMAPNPAPPRTPLDILKISPFRKIAISRVLCIYRNPKNTIYNDPPNNKVQANIQATKKGS